MENYSDCSEQLRLQNKSCRFALLSKKCQSVSTGPDYFSLVILLWCDSSFLPSVFAHRSTVMMTEVCWWGSGKSFQVGLILDCGSVAGTFCVSGQKVVQSAMASVGSLLPSLAQVVQCTLHSVHLRWLYWLYVYSNRYFKSLLNCSIHLFLFFLGFNLLVLFFKDNNHIS